MNHPDDIMSAILPEDEQDEFPSGFSIVGHVGASVNLILQEARGGLD